MKPVDRIDAREMASCCPVADEPGLGALSTPRGNLPLKLLDVTAKVSGLFAETSMRQTYVNTLGVPLEATYIFPLPDRAAVTRFRLEVGERIVEGELQDRGQARATYDHAIRAGHRAAISEEERPGVFTIRAGNLMPGDEATVWLTLAGPLPYADGEVTYQLPLVVAPRYCPGSALPGEQVGDGVTHDTDRVPDASRISPPVLLPGFASPVRLSIAVELEPAGLPLAGLRSSLPAERQDAPGGRARVEVRPGQRLDRDFILRWTVASAGLRPSLALVRDADDPAQGTFALTIVPPADAPRARRAKDVVILLDRSGSMEGWKMVAARRATARVVDALGPSDRFTVYAFDDQLETPGRFVGTTLMPATDRNRFRAVEFLATMTSRGGTELQRPLDLAASSLLDPAGAPRMCPVGHILDAREERCPRCPAGAAPVPLGPAKDARDKVIVLITDGQVGDEDQILRSLGRRAGQVRVFTLGVDKAVNGAFLRRLAAIGGGSCELVESEDRLDAVMAKVHRRIDSPVLTDLALVPDGLELVPGSLMPDRLPDLFAGQPVVVMGRVRGRSGTVSPSPGSAGEGWGGGSIAARALDATGATWQETVAPEASTSAALGASWARGLIRQLEDRYLVAPPHEQPRLEREIVATSLRWRVLCRFTAFVAVDRAEVVNRGGNQHRITQAVEQPAGWGQDAEPAEEDAREGTGAFAPLGGDLDDLMDAAPARAVFNESRDAFEVLGAPPAPAADPFAVSASAEPFGADGGWVGGGGAFGAPGGAVFDAPTGSPFGGGPASAPPPARGPIVGAGGGRASGSKSGSMNSPMNPPMNPREKSAPMSPMAPPPPASASPASAGGFVGGLANVIGGLFGAATPPASFKRSEAAKDAAPELDGVVLAAYRRRAEELVTLLAAEVRSHVERTKELGRLLVLLERLLDDLRSVGAPADLVRPLDVLVRELVVVRAAGGCDALTAERLWRRAADVLAEYVRGSASALAAPPAPPAPRREFWK